MNSRILLGILSITTFIPGIVLLLQEKQKPDCNDRYWCGDPQQADLAWMLIVIGVVLQAIKCWVT